MGVLFVLNVQNSFLSPSGSVYMGEKAEILKVRLKDYLSVFKEEKIFFREVHSLEDKFFIGDKTHSIATTQDVNIPDEFKEHANLIFDKSRYDAFYNTQIDAWLKRNRIGSVGLVGVETHTSVLFTAESLRNAGYDVFVIEPCVMSREDYFHGYAIMLMRHYLGVRVNNE